MKTKRKGKLDTNKFKNKLVEINFEEISKKIIVKKPREYILSLCDLKNGSIFDFSINKREIAISKVL